MIDVSTIKYRVIVVDSKGKKYDISDYVQKLGWEENDGELSQRITFTSRNDKTSKGTLSSILKLGCRICISARHGSKTYQEVARGTIMSWNPTRQNSQKNLTCTCYDDLYNLQKSQDNFYFRSGTGTKSRIKKILKKWKVTLGTYKGPNKKQGKKRYQNQYLSDMLLDILNDAAKKGGDKCILRMAGSKVQVIPRGSNPDVYVFNTNNAVALNRNQSIENLVTRVKVISTSKNKDKTKTEATVKGLTKYGIRQRIYTRGSDETLKAAKKAAQEILDENGDVEKTITVQSPDVPYIRKGDLVYIDIGALDEYYYVKSVRHDADTLSMQMEVKPAKKSTVSNNKKTDKKIYKVGDKVTFKGGTHYVSSTGSKGDKAKAGKAKITKTASGAKHPYHLIHTDSKSNVYGWVDEGTFS
ncbi:MAG: hypothetical protein NC489_26535 [Ruminococcus flavefaciens]|nr:hypothetical protein [Ruminococcus flavefaciens]